MQCGSNQTLLCLEFRIKQALDPGVEAVVEKPSAKAQRQLLSRNHKPLSGGEQRAEAQWKGGWKGWTLSCYGGLLTEGHRCRHCNIFIWQGGDSPNQKGEWSQMIDSAGPGKESPEQTGNRLRLCEQSEREHFGSMVLEGWVWSGKGGVLRFLGKPWKVSWASDTPEGRGVHARRRRRKDARDQCLDEAELHDWLDRRDDLRNFSIWKGWVMFWGGQQADPWGSLVDSRVLMLQEMALHPCT